MAANAYDALIIGAGPGGSTAATFLSRAGRRVLLEHGTTPLIANGVREAPLDRGNTMLEMMLGGQWSRFGAMRERVATLWGPVPSAELADPLVPVFLAHLPPDLEPGQLKDKGVQSLHFIHDDVHYLGTYHCLSTSTTPDWLVCIVLPEADAHYASPSEHHPIAPGGKERT